MIDGFQSLFFDNHFYIGCSHFFQILFSPLSHTFQCVIVPYVLIYLMVSF